MAYTCERIELKGLKNGSWIEWCDWLTELEMPVNSWLAFASINCGQSEWLTTKISVTNLQLINKKNKDFPQMLVRRGRDKNIIKNCLEIISFYIEKWFAKIKYWEILLILYFITLDWVISSASFSTILVTWRKYFYTNFLCPILIDPKKSNKEEVIFQQISG